mgnify:FL=1
MILSLHVTVHPHACGEHEGGDVFEGPPPGSSPRMWGTRRGHVEPDDRDRFIPTHVGNTTTVFVRGPLRPVHPHACGEHWLYGANIRLLFGSSPRMWGTRSGNIILTWRIRFIPTHVGNTLFLSFLLDTYPVHPHACGEHQIIKVRFVFLFGSSPRMWGTQSCLDYLKEQIRFIPTHVGNTETPPLGSIR